MSRKYISSLKTGEVVEDVFLVLKKEVKETREKKPYLNLQLADKSGSIEARKWDAAPQLCDSFNKDAFIKIKGVVETFNNTLQIRINEIFPIAEAQVQMAEFIPSTEKDISVMMNELKQIIKTVQDPYLSKLLYAFFADESFCKMFSTAPAATQYHHAFLGGLLEHILSVAKLAISFSNQYPTIKEICYLRVSSYMISEKHGNCPMNVVSNIPMRDNLPGTSSRVSLWSMKRSKK